MSKEARTITINRQTLIPIGLMFGIFTLIVPGVWYIANMSADVQANKQDINEKTDSIKELKTEIAQSNTESRLTREELIRNNAVLEAVIERLDKLEQQQ